MTSKGTPNDGRVTVSGPPGRIAVGQGWARRRWSGCQRTDTRSPANWKVMAPLFFDRAGERPVALPAVCCVGGFTFGS